MKLYEIPRDSRIYGMKLRMEHEPETKERVVIFRRTDGMYSYCEVEEMDGEAVLYKDAMKAVVHLNATTPLEEYKDGYKIKGGA